MLSLDNARRSLAPLFAMISLVVLVACGTAAPAPTPEPPTPAPAVQAGTVITTDKGQYRDLTADELQAMMAHKDFFLVDVHVPHEGKMPQLDARIPYDQITQQLDKLPSDKSAKIVLICKGGGMSTQAAKDLVALGYTDVYNLKGGFVAWQAKGYELTKEP